ncbi:hypothetical protein [Streptomyces sp. NBC_01006]|uniref:effector-associated constant component EACC1 n=1 Tax=Streptomyces sp. NBC_01006 TaxID=2903716 RepID=UPI003869212F|nr:hypothetical protein OG509_38480 [Streptomyces sp. NBC_01006]
MQLALSVTSSDLDGTGSQTASTAALADLRRWLQRHPELRDRLGRMHSAEPAAGEMGAVGELLPVLLAPGGLTAALGAALVAWLQNRRGNQTVTVTLPDSTQITVSSENVCGLSAQDAGDVARQIAAALHNGGSQAIPAPPETGQQSPEAAQGTV